MPTIFTWNYDLRLVPSQVLMPLHNGPQLEDQFFCHYCHKAPS